MTIGLVRHFKVRHPFPKQFLLTKAEVVRWFDDYEIAEIEYHDVDLRGVRWQRCFSSPMTRALDTAQHIYKEEIISVDTLREFDVLPLLSNTVRLPLIAWALLAWFTYSIPNKATSALRKTINSFIDQQLLTSHHNTLIVSHVFIMIMLQKELKKRGFTGDTFGFPHNGRVYLLDRS